MKKSLLITGANGWFGRVFAANINNLIKNYFDEVFFLVRNKPGPHLNQINKSNIKVLQQDLNQEIDLDINFTHCIHMATPDSSLNDSIKSQLMLEQTNNIYEFCTKKKINKFVYLSSGAIYGEFNYKIKEEDFKFETIKDLSSFDGYQTGKMNSEKYLLNSMRKTSFDIIIARCFSFVGPNMPLSNFAITNIIEEILLKKKVTIYSDVIRSYLHENELFYCLMRLLIMNNKYNIYNVGSDKEISILEITNKIFNILKIKASINFLNKTSLKRNYYVPNNNRLKDEINFNEDLNLEATVNHFNKELNL